MKFPEKLSKIVNECTSGAIGWGIDGDTIFIDYEKFEHEFLGEKSGVFKTKNVVSFVRQLNLYGFRKCSRYNDVHEFRNQYFVRGRKDLLKFLKRKFGYRLDVPISQETEKPKKYKEVKEKENHVPTSTNSDCSITSSESLRSSSYSPSSYALNSMSYGWWRNPYFPLHSMYNLTSESGNVANQPEVNDGEYPGTAYGRDENLSWKNFDMYRNIVLVPVPAHQFGMFGGFYNRSMGLPNSMLPQNESKSTSMTQERSINVEENDE